MARRPRSTAETRENVRMAATWLGGKRTSTKPRPNQLQIPGSVRTQQPPTVSPAGASGLTGDWTADVTESRYLAAGPLPGENNTANWGTQKLTLRPDGVFATRNARFPVTTGGRCFTER